MSVRLDSHGVGTTVVLSGETIQGEWLATVESISPDPNNDGESRYSLRTHDLEGALESVVVGPDGGDELGRYRVTRLATHPVDHLFAEMPDIIGDYPTGTEPVWARVRGTAFFPGGSGLWRPDIGNRLPPMPEGGVMVLGQDYYTKSGYLEFLTKANELETSTWRELRKLFAAVNLVESRCFFTNAWMGLRSNGSATGKYAGARDAGFTQRCAQYLRRQIATQRPRLIITLGGNVLRMMAAVAPDISKSWGTRPSLSRIDAANVGLVRNADFPDTELVRANVVALVHPCMRNSNVHRRTFRVDGRFLSGNAAEIALLTEGLKGS